MPAFTFFSAGDLTSFSTLKLSLKFLKAQAINFPHLTQVRSPYSFPPNISYSSAALDFPKSETLTYSNPAPIRTQI